MLFFWILLLLFPIAGFAQLTPEQVLNIRQISDMRFSPDGRFIAFTVTEPVKGTERNRDIWMLEVALRNLRPLTSSPKSEGSPKWSPDGSRLATRRARVFP